MYKIETKVDQNLNVGLDIGGSLGKIALFLPTNLIVADQQLKEYELNLVPEYKEAKLYIKIIKSLDVHNLINFAKSNIPNSQSIRIYSTGGGSFKFAQEINDSTTKVENKAIVSRIDEMNSLVSGLSFIYHKISNPFFKIDENGNMINFDYNDIFPIILVNVGSGISILRVDSFKEFKRVSGSLLGGGTLVGLANLLIGVNDYDKLMELASKGDNSTLDFLAKDLSPLIQINIVQPVVASSFGKASQNTQNITMRMDKDLSNPKHYKAEDVALSLIKMISYNTGHLGYLVGRVNKVKNILFAGNYVRNNMMIMKFITDSVRFCSKNEVWPFFCKYSGFLGCLGAVFSDKTE